MKPRILAVAGSTRKESFIKKLVQIAVKGAKGAGAVLTMLDLKDFPLPLFDQDLEAEHGMPDNGTKFKRLVIDHDGLLVASPEYNSSITAVLKNAIEWLSTPTPGEPPLVAFRGKSPP
ncbi:MAG: NADPH-dependent reductase [Planctomycetota bacterium]|nr:NADPH-dependent reductase [Planctomycetota bacterium]